MGRRRQAVKELGLAVAYVLAFVLMLLTMVITMILLVPIGLVWVINPDFGDRLLHNVMTPLAWMLSGGDLG